MQLIDPSNLQQSCNYRLSASPFPNFIQTNSFPDRLSTLWIPPWRYHIARMKIAQKQSRKNRRTSAESARKAHISSRQLGNAILHVTENDCKGRSLPGSSAICHTVYVRMNRWNTNGVLQRLFEDLQRKNFILIGQTN